MNSEILEELLSLCEQDNQLRRCLLDAGRLHGTYAEEMQAIHRDNAQRLANIVSHHGWPGIPLVGLDGCRAAWQIAQHANCTPALQRHFLVLMEQAAEAGEIPPRQVAFLSDRIRFNEGKPQSFGTVLDWDADGTLGCCLEDPDNVDFRRQSVGLPPFQEHLLRHRQEVAAEGGRPPDDFPGYQQRQRKWAEAMGWR
jgi:hypothetical protein